MMLDKDGQTILNDLRRHWESHYLIDFKDGAWIAAPVSDPFTIITRDSSGELREAIRIDYAERQQQARRTRWPAGNSGP